VKKLLWTLVGIVVVIVVVAGLWTHYHKNTKKVSTTTSTTSTQTSTHSQTAVVNNVVLTTKTDAHLGQYLADPNGKALYTYANDTTNTSNCSGSCLDSWPPYLATSRTDLPTNVSSTKRTDDGKFQYTYKGKPLYYFFGDTQGNQVTGDGVGNFNVAKP